MPITAAQVESNGWVLRLTVTGAMTQPNTNFGAYNFDVDGAPRLLLAASHPGFVKSGGTAVGGAMLRSIIGLRPLRQVVNPALPTVKILDELDLGGGAVQVRVALSQTVYATETGVSLSTLAGWRTGEGAQSGIAVANNSTAVAPVPIMRWVLPPYDVSQGPFRLSLIVGSHHPVGFEPVAGVKFAVTDGTRVKEYWTTALDTDNSYGDNLRCYTIVVDPSTATALTAGLLRCDAEVYPFLGAMRTTDPAGTRSMASIRTAAQSTAAEAPWAIGYDPAGTRYSNRFAYVDPVNGTNTASAAMVQPTLAAAKALAPASRPRSVTTAIQAARLAAFTLPAANGQASQVTSLDGLRVLLAAGEHIGLGPTSVSTAFTPEIPVVIEGDPDDPDARNTVFLEGTTTARNIRASRARFRRLTVRAGDSEGLHTSTVSQLFLDDLTFQNKAGQEQLSAPVFQLSAPNAATQWTIMMTRVKWWRTGTLISATNRQTQLMRACEHTRQARATVLVKNRSIPPAEDGFTNYSSTYNSVGYSQPSQTVNLGHLEDWVVAFNDGRALRWEGLVPRFAPPALAGTTLNSHRRHLILNNVFERVSGTNTPGADSDTNFGKYSENENVIVRDIIIEGNSFAGAGVNAFYNDPVPATLADTDSQNNLGFNIRNANNAYDRHPSKQDEFNDDTTRNIRRANGFPTAEGFRAQLTGMWSTHFGTDMEGVVDTSRAESGPSNFLRDGLGPRSVQFQPKLVTVGWANDACEKGSDQGMGDYTPTAGSVFLNRISRANSDRDWLNQPRLNNGAAGAIEAAASGVATLAAQNARHGHSATASGLGTVPVMAPQSAAHQHRAGVAPAGWSTTLTAANALMTSAALMAVVTWQANVAPFGAVMASSSSAPVVGVDGGTAVALNPLRSRHAMTAMAAPVRLEGGVPAERTLFVCADARTIFVTETKQEN
jgi:hypothetical protein